MFTNPFVEGLLMLVLGIGCVVGGNLLKITELSPLGQTLTGIGLGYIGHAALVQPPPQ